MRIGSLVEYVTDLVYNDMQTPEKNTIYTVKFVGVAKSIQRPRLHDCIRLEEIVNGIAPDGQEWVYVAEHFREVQPPMDISAVIEESFKIENYEKIY